MPHYVDVTVAWLRRAWPALVLPLTLLAMLVVLVLQTGGSSSCASYGQHLTRLDGHCVRLVPEP